ncbi:MAG: helix-turn-helix domain-containing protein [Saprospiraceae bacterium]
MESIVLTSVTREQLKNELRDELLSAIKLLLSESSKKDLYAKEWLNSKETESFLKISSVTRWNWTNSGILKSYKIGNRLRYRKDEVLQALMKVESKIR